MNTDETTTAATPNDVSSNFSDQSTDSMLALKTNTDETPDVSDAPLALKETLEEPLKPRVIIMHASVGSGHRSAANAIAQAFELMRDEARLAASTNEQFVSSDTSTDSTDGAFHELPSELGQAAQADPIAQALAALPAIPLDLEVEVIDILDWGRIVFDGDRTASMFTGATRPLYDLTWRYTLTGRLLWGGGTAWSHIMYPSFTDHVRKVHPLAIVCTHITAANVAVGARMLTGFEFPIVCVPTDYETEGLWPHKTGDLFCVANESMAETLRPRKVPDERIRITGIPTRDDFRRTFDKQETREKLQLPQDKNIVLALAGAYLPRPYIHFRETLDKVLPYLHTFDDLHLVFIAGSDADYARHLRQECEELKLGNVTVLDYVEDMAALMAASDLVICKSGGLVVTECLCAQVPMILLGKAYGQEKANVSMLTSLGAAMHVTTARELLDTLRYVDRYPESTRAMLLNGGFLRHPDAARNIASATLELAAHPKHPNSPERNKHFMRFYWGGKPAHTR